MNPSDASVIMVIIAIMSPLIFWWRQVLRILAGVFILLIIVGLFTVLSAMQHIP